MTVSVVLAILVSGLYTGGLARLAIPGPDPMPLWLTIAIGLVGSIAGAVIGRALSNDNGFLISFLSFSIAMVLVAAYRRFVQKRPVFGPGALAFPERGLGVERTRQRLQKLGVDLNALRPSPGPTPDPGPALERTRLEGMLRELHEAGVLTDEELAEKLAGLQDETVGR